MSSGDHLAAAMTTMASGPRRTVGDVVDELGFGLAQVRVVLTAGGVYFADGVLSVALLALVQPLGVLLGLESLERGWLSSLVFLGKALGNLAATFSDQLGRKPPILASYVLGALAPCLAALLARDLFSAGACYLLAGIAMGIAVPAWNAFSTEVSPIAWRLHVNGSSMILFCLGTCVGALALFAVSPNLQNLEGRCRELLLWIALPSVCLLAVCLLLGLPESPHFLQVRRRTSEAREVLAGMRRLNNRPGVSLDFDETTASSAAAAPREDDGLLRSWVGGWRQLVGSPRLLRGTLVLLFSTAVLNFAYYGFMYALPVVLPGMGLLVSPALNLAIGGIAELFGVLVAFTLSKAPRNRLVQIYLCGLALSQCAFAYGAHSLMLSPGGADLSDPASSATSAAHLATGAIWACRAFCGIGWLAVYLYAAEFFPTSCRTTGSGICIAGGRVGSVLSGPIFETFRGGAAGGWAGGGGGNHGAGHLWFFGLIAMLCLLNAVLASLLVDTKNQALLDFQTEEEKEDAASRAPLIMRSSTPLKDGLP